MIKNSLHYVKVYDYDGNYEYTDFLWPYSVTTDDYKIEGPKYLGGFLKEYWVDYISKEGFTILENGKVIDELPNCDSDGNIIYDLYLVDKKNNTFHYSYDRIEPIECKNDEDNIHKYYCKYVLESG